MWCVYSPPPSSSCVVLELVRFGSTSSDAHTNYSTRVCDVCVSVCVSVSAYYTTVVCAIVASACVSAGYQKRKAVRGRVQGNGARYTRWLPTARNARVCTHAHHSGGGGGDPDTVVVLRRHLARTRSLVAGDLVARSRLAGVFPTTAAAR